MNINILRSPTRIMRYAGYINEVFFLIRKYGLGERNIQLILEAHFKGEINTFDALKAVGQLTGSKDFESEISFLIHKPRVEIHPVNGCNYRCSFCSWYPKYDSSKERTVLPLKALHNLQKFNPKAIVISGGFCEPGLYFDSEEKADINSLLAKIKSILPQVEIGMNSNGTTEIKATYNLLSWLRINIDAATDATYKRIKGGAIEIKEIFSKCKRYLDNCKSNAQRPYLGFGFLYFKDNIHELVKFIQLVYDYFHESDGFSNVNIQFRPLRPLINERMRVAESGIFTHACSSNDIKNMKDEIKKVVKNNSAIRLFIKSQTNINEIFYRYTNGNIKFEGDYFPDRCFIPLVSTIITPFGNCVACVTSAEAEMENRNNQIILANFSNLQDRNEKNRFILNMLYSTQLVMPYCNPIECSQGEILSYSDMIDGFYKKDTRFSETSFF